MTSVFGLMWQSACSKSFCKLGILAASRAIHAFWSPSNAVSLRRSGDESLRRLPTRMSSRSAVLDEPLSRNTKASRPTTAITATRTPIVMGLIMLAHLVLRWKSPLGKGHSIPQQDPFLEQVGRQLDARGLEAATRTLGRTPVASNWPKARPF